MAEENECRFGMSTAGFENIRCSFRILLYFQRNGYAFS